MRPNPLASWRSGPSLLVAPHLAGPIRIERIAAGLEKAYPQP